jgi:hypothetical protein
MRFDDLFVMEDKLLLICLFQSFKVVSNSLIGLSLKFIGFARAMMPKYHGQQA